MERKTIIDMKNGEEGWVQEQALFTDEKTHIWIHSDWYVYPKKIDMMTLNIIKENDRIYVKETQARIINFMKFPGYSKVIPVERTQNMRLLRNLYSIVPMSSQQ